MHRRRIVLMTFPPEVYTTGLCSFFSSSCLGLPGSATVQIHQPEIKVTVLQVIEVQGTARICCCRCLNTLYVCIYRGVVAVTGLQAYGSTYFLSLWHCKVLQGRDLCVTAPALIHFKNKFHRSICGCKGPQIHTLAYIHGSLSAACANQ